jgi:hypothetical protein
LALWRFKIWLIAAKLGEPPRTFTLDQRLERRTDKLGLLLYPRQGLCFGDQVVIKRYSSLRTPNR